jgi:hypothetical protein
MSRHVGEGPRAAVDALGRAIAHRVRGLTDDRLLNLVREPLLVRVRNELGKVDQPRPPQAVHLSCDDPFVVESIATTLKAVRVRYDPPSVASLGRAIADRVRALPDGRLLDLVRVPLLVGLRSEHAAVDRQALHASGTVRERARKGEPAQRTLRRGAGR